MNDRLNVFLCKFAERKPAFFKELQRAQSSYPEIFCELAEPMLEWAEASLGKYYFDFLIDGYCEFVIDVNRSQLLYEKRRAYQYSTYKEVYDQTYNSEEFMNLYHWGVYTTTFAWEHHLRLFEFFKHYFLSQLLQSKPGKLLDLGCGSGIWHLLALRAISDWQVTAVDISETSIELTRKMWKTFMQPRPNVKHEVADALKYALTSKADAAISCFLLEHLETPDRLLKNLANNIKPGAYAFITCALTAAEIDHIYEFRHEAQVASMAEKSGFRVIATLSSAPRTVNIDSYYLPRSMALVLQKRRGDVW